MSPLLNTINGFLKYQQAGFQWTDPHTGENLHALILILDQLSEIVYEKAIILDILFIFNNQLINAKNLLTDYLRLFLNYVAHYKDYPNKFLVPKFSNGPDEATTACRKLADWCEVNSVDPLPIIRTIQWAIFYSNKVLT